MDNDYLFDEINKAFDKRDRHFDKLEKMIWGLYVVFIVLIFV